MKKVYSLILIFLLILPCFGCSNSNNNQSDQNTSSNSSSTSSTTDNSNSQSSVVGDWEFKGDINRTQYDITLDLENNNEFEFDVDEENKDDDIEAELNGTYTFTDNTITLDVVTLQNNSNYLTGEVVQNAQLELQYKLIDNNTLELSNASKIITFIPKELTLKRDN